MPSTDTEQVEKSEDDAKYLSLHSPVESVDNISHNELCTTEESVLNKGLNFATIIKLIPYIIAPIDEIEDETRWKVKQILEKVNQSKPNITK